MHDQKRKFLPFLTSFAKYTSAYADSISSLSPACAQTSGLTLSPREWGFWAAHALYGPRHCMADMTLGTGSQGRMSVVVNVIIGDILFVIVSVDGS